MTDASVRRRGDGEHAIYFSADKNRYIGAVSVGFGPDGKRLRRRVSGKTKQEVRDKLRALHAELSVGLQSSAGYTVRAAVDDWLEHGLSGRSARTVQLYRDGVRPLTDRIGARPLRKLSAADVRSVLAVLSGQLSTRSLQIAHNCLVRAIRHAESNDLVGRNVAALIRPPAGHEGRPSKALSVDQAQELLRAAADEGSGGSPHRLHAYVDGRTGKLVTVPFHYVGIAREFPTAPRDSFFVANASYVAARTGNSSVGEFLVNTDGTPPPMVAARLRMALGPTPGITDIVTSRRVTASTLTAVDLSGLTKVELSFALALAISATALLLTLGFTERRRTFALARMLGAHARQLGGFVWCEVLVTGVTGAILGAIAGWVLSQMLVKVLTGVFDPPPEYLAVPWAYLGTVAGIAVLGLVVAALTTIRAARRPPLTVLREL